MAGNDELQALRETNQTLHSENKDLKGQKWHEKWYIVSIITTLLLGLGTALYNFAYRLDVKIANISNKHHHLEGRVAQIEQRYYIGYSQTKKHNNKSLNQTIKTKN